MKLFVFELISAGGMGPEPPAGLLTEGLVMLKALVEDFERVPGVETVTLLNRTWGVTVGKACRHIGPGEERHAFMEQVALADAVLIIAPEFDDLLAERSRCVLAAGKRLLGSTPGAIDLTGDKLALARHFTKHGIPTPATDLVGRASWPRYPAVCKPRFGAGSQAMFLVQDESLLSTQLAAAQRELPDAEFLTQPFVPGQPASVLFLIGPKQQLALQPATQRLSADGRFRYLGGMVPLHPDLARRAVSLARRGAGHRRRSGWSCGRGFGPRRGS